MNAKEEFLNLLGTKKVLCAQICLSYPNENILNLSLNYNEEEYNNFLNLLDFEYDCGYGMQYINGTVWFADNTWATRGDYDGAEWWEYHFVPEIPEELKVV